MKNLEFINLEACDEAAELASGKTWQEVYSTCHRGDWLLWLFAKTNPDNRRELTLTKGHCANTVRHLMNDERSIAAVDAAIAYGEGKITKEELHDAAAATTYATYTAAYAAFSSASSSASSAIAAANYAGYAAADASYAGYAASYAAFSAFTSAAYAATYATSAATYAASAAASSAAASAAFSAFSAAAAAAYASAKKENQKQTADICRKYLPIELWNI